MARRVQIANFADWSGGLNLASDPVAVGANESPDIINFDLTEQGGLRPRKVTTPWEDAPLAPRAIVPFETPSQSDCLVFDGNGQVWSHAVQNFILSGTRPTGDRPVRAVIADDKLYAQNGLGAPWVWDGSTGTNLTEGFNDALDAPVGGKGFTSEVVAFHLGSLWIGNTTEDDVQHHSRIRWSHPKNPEDWQTLDFIDVDFGDGDHITAMVPLGRMLLVFKQHSLHAIQGQFPNYTVSTLSRAVGAMSAELTCATERGCYFWHQSEGAYFFDGAQHHHIFHSLLPALTDGRMVATEPDDMCLEYVNRKLWVSVPWAETPDVGRTWVFNSYIGKSGAWSSYEFAERHTAYAVWHRSDGTVEYLAGGRHDNGVVRLEQSGTHDGGATEMRASAQTPWLDLRQPGVTKRWKHWEAIVRADSTYDVTVQLFRDWEPVVAREFPLHVTGQFGGADGVLVWDDDSTEWDQDAWWGANARTPTLTERVRVVRGPTLGTSRAISLRFSVGPQADLPLFSLNGLIFKFLPKRVRS